MTEHEVTVNYDSNMGFYYVKLNGRVVDSYNDEDDAKEVRDAIKSALKK